MQTRNLHHLADLLERLRRLTPEQEEGPVPAAPGPTRLQELREVLDELRAALERQREREQDDHGRIEHLENSCRELGDSLVYYRELFEYAPDCYLVTDRHGNITEVNQAAIRLFGTSREFLVGKPLPFLVGNQARRAFFTRLNQLNRMAEPIQDWEVRFQTRRGTLVDASVTVTPVPDPEGSAAAPDRAVGTTPGGTPRPRGEGTLRWLIRDVSARRQAAEDLQAEKEFAESLIDTAQAIVLVLDVQGRINRVNLYVEMLSGYRRSELLGQLWPDALIAEPDRPRVQEGFLRALESGQGLRAVHALRTRDGLPRAVEWSSKVLTGPGGAPRAVLVVGHDITELQEAQRRAVQAERLAAIGQMAAGLAHESRNAIQRSLACLQRLSWKLQDQPEALDLVARAQKAQDDLLRLYEDVRQYAAPIRVECRPTNLAEVWREAWADVTSLYPGRQARLEEEGVEEDLVCSADRFRLLQVFRNILENALAASPDSVRVVVSCRETTLGGRPALAVAVRDNGPGLTPEQRRRLFEPFFTTKVKGTGLGMAIAKRIMEAHGGQVAVGDRPSPGAEILLTLPRSQS